MGNGLAKDIMYVSHEHEQWCGECLSEREVLGGVGKMGENWTTVIVHQ